jgi:integrase
MAWKESYTTNRGEKRYRVGYRDGIGRKHFKTFNRSKDADTYMLDVTRRAQLGHLYEADPDTFGGFAGIHVTPAHYKTGKTYVRLTGDGWFERYSHSVRKSTFDRRKDVLQYMRELLPLELDRITPALIEDIVLSVSKEHARQARVLHDTIKMVMRAASVRGQHVHPGVLTLKPPAGGPKTHRVALDEDEIERLAAASTEPHFIRVAAYTGLRQGELFALRDCDINLEVGTIYVTGTVYEGKRTELPKTEASIRTLHIAPQVVRELKLQLLKRPAGTDIIFPSPRGFFQRPQHFDPKFNRWAAEAGLSLKTHDLRRTYASLMVKAGVHPKVLQEMMGHKSFNVTMTLYAQLADGQRKDAADMLGKLLAGGE